MPAFSIHRPIALSLAASMLTLTACGTPQNFGVGRNPLGSNSLPGQGQIPHTGTLVFDGNPEQLAALFLNLRTQARLTPHQKVALEILALDRNGKRIDPRKLNLRFTSKNPAAITVDSQGLLTGITPFESSLIQVEDARTQTRAEAEVMVSPNTFNGNPQAVSSLQLVLRQMTVPGKGETAQYLLIAKDTLGNAIDPARLSLDWSVSNPNAFQVDKNGLVTALSPSGLANVIVRDSVSGRTVTGQIRSLGQGDSTGTPVIPTRPTVPAAPGVPTTPTSPSNQGSGSQPTQPGPATGNPAEIASIVLTPSFTSLPTGKKIQLTVTITDKNGKNVDPASVPLQWVSNLPDALSVDNQGTVTAKTPSQTARITVSVPGQNLSASALVASTGAQQSSGGGGGGGGGGGSPALPPNLPALSTQPVSINSFNVLITPPVSGIPVQSFKVIIGGAPGTTTFNVPATGSPILFPIPAEALLTPDTPYPVSLVAVGINGLESPIVNGFGSTLPAEAPVNLFAGNSAGFSGILAVPADAPFAMNIANGNALSAGDASPNEVITVTLQPNATNFGSFSLANSPALPGTVVVNGSGTQGSPLTVNGPVADVNTALNNLIYTPAAGFVGQATATMTTSDTVEGGNTPDDIDTLTFSVNSAAPTPPENRMNGSATFSNLTTSVDAPITLNVINNSVLAVEDPNGTSMSVTLTPQNGSLKLESVSSGVTVLPRGNESEPLVLQGIPIALNNALSGGVTFTPNPGFNGTASITMVSNDGNASDTDSLNIDVIQPSNLFNAQRTFPTDAIATARSTPLTFDGGHQRALSVVYPPGTEVQVDLILQDSMGNNGGATANGSFAFDTMRPGTVSENATPGQGSNAIRLSGPIDDVNAYLAGLRYSPFGTNTGTYRLRMDSVDINNSALTDTNDVVSIIVSAPPVNRYNNNPANSSFPNTLNVGSPPLALGYNTPLTFAGFYGTALSVTDPDSANLTVTLTPSNGQLTRASNTALPTGVTLRVNNVDTLTPTGTSTHPIVITGSPTNINSLLNGGIVFTPSNAGTGPFSGPAMVTVATSDGASIDIDMIEINISGIPENTLDDNNTFPTQPILGAPGVAIPMSVATNRELAVRNYLSNANVEVTLSVPSGALTIPGSPTGVVISGTPQEMLITGNPSNINNALLGLVFTPAAGNLAEPLNLNLTMSSSGGTLGDENDQVPILITNPPRNTYNGSETDGNFPSSPGLSIFAGQDLIMDGQPHANQPTLRLGINDDSNPVTVLLTPNNNARLNLSSVPNGVTVHPTHNGASVNNPLQLSGSVADVQAALGNLVYTPGNTGSSNISMVVSDGGPSPDTNTIEFNVRLRPQNAFDNNATFPGTAIPMVAGQPNAVRTDTGNPVLNPSVRPLSVLNLVSYGTGDTATVTLAIPVGDGTLDFSAALPTGVTLSDGATGTHTLTLSATGANIPNLNTALGNLRYTAPALNSGDPVRNVTLTMTSGSISDTDTLPLVVTRVPVNQFNGGATFPGTRLTVVEGTPLLFTAGNVVSVDDDSAEITVTLRPSLAGGLNSGTASITNTGNITVPNGLSGNNTTPLVIRGSVGAVNQALATLSFSSAEAANGNAQIDMTTTDGAGIDTNDAILLSLEARAINLINGSPTFPGNGAPVGVSLNGTVALNTANSRQLSVDFYLPGDTVTVALALSGTSPGTLTISGVGTSGSGTANVQIVGSPSQVNSALANLVYQAPNDAGTVTLSMTSSNGGSRSDNAGGDTIQFTVANQTPTNTVPSGTLNVVSSGNDSIPFGLTDPGTGGAGITAPSVSDDSANVRVTLTPPSGLGTLSLRGGSPIAPTGAGTNVSPMVLEGTRADVNSALALLRFTPTDGASGSGNIQVLSFDLRSGSTGATGQPGTDTDNIAINVQRRNTTVPTGVVDGAVLQINRTGNSVNLTASNVIVSGPDQDAGARVQFLKISTTDSSDVQILGTSPITSFSNSSNTGSSALSLTTIPTTLVDPVNGNEATSDGKFVFTTRLVDSSGNPLSNTTAPSNTTSTSLMVYPDRTIYGITRNTSASPTTSQVYLINTNNTAAGNGALTQVSGARLFSTSENDVSTSLAKHPTNGHVYYIDDQGTSAGRLRVWDPAQGPNGGFANRGNLSISSDGNVYSFNDFPARLEFNHFPTAGGPVLYAAAARKTQDSAPTLSGLYRITGAVTGTPTPVEVKLTLSGNDFPLSNSGDLVFEPTTGILYITDENRLFRSTTAVAHDATTVALQEITLTPGNFGGTVPPIPNLSFDATPNTILLTTLSGGTSRIYRLTLPGGAATILSSGTHSGVSLVDTSSAHGN